MPRVPIKKLAREIAALHREIATLHDKSNELYRIVVDKTAILQAACPHTDVVVKFDYIEGSYLDRSQDLRHSVFVVWKGAAHKGSLWFIWIGWKSRA